MLRYFIRFAKMFFVVTAFFSSGRSIAQINYINYHKEIIKCEQDFLFYDHIPNALADYKKVFEKYPKPFLKDCFIALQLACFVGDKSSAEYFFTRSFERGLDWTATEQSPSIRKLVNGDTAFRRRIVGIYQARRQKFLKNIDITLRNRVIAMKNLDDSFKGRMTSQAGPLLVKMMQQYDSVLSSNTKALIELTRKYGFLSDDKIGYMDYGFNNDTMQKKEFIYSLRSLVDQLYYHHSCCFFAQMELLKKSLENGDIQPTMYASFYEWGFLDLKEKRKELALCSPHFVQERFYNICPVLSQRDKCADSKLVDQDRLTVGIASVGHYRRKRAFEEKNGL